jgi:hypothetical protein
MCYRGPDGHCLGLFFVFIIFSHNKKNVEVLNEADNKYRENYKTHVQHKNENRFLR